MRAREWFGVTLAAGLLAGCSWNWDAWDPRRTDGGAADVPATDTGGGGQDVVDVPAVVDAGCGVLGAPCCAGTVACALTLECVNNACACAAGRFDCNNTPSDGCEIDTTSDPDNCGACLNRCRAPQRNCVSGVCQ